MASRAVISFIVVILTIACVVAIPTSDKDVFAVNDCQTTVDSNNVTHLFPLTQGDDIILAEVEVSDPGHTAGQVGVYFTYPPKGGSANHEITCIIAKDLLPGSGGDATLVGGGLGHTFVQVHLTSKYRGKADFAITVKGKPVA